jgi:hypothetical protein
LLIRDQLLRDNKRNRNGSRLGVLRRNWLPQRVPERSNCLETWLACVVLGNFDEISSMPAAWEIKRLCSASGHDLGISVAATEHDAFRTLAIRHRRSPIRNNHLH